MKKEVYEALKSRITVTAKEIDLWHWEFENEGLNEGISCFDERYVDAMCQDMRMKSGNMWNIAQRVLGFLHAFGHDDIEDRLVHPLPDQKFKVEIRHTDSYEETEMTLGELAATRRAISDWIVKAFRWSDYPKEYTHLVYCVRYDDRFNIYTYGNLITDKQFDEMFVGRKDVDIQRIWAYHRS